MQKLTAVAWVIADPARVTPDSVHSVHAGDRCWLGGCNRLFDAGKRVAYTAEIGAGSHAE